MPDQQQQLLPWQTGSFQPWMVGQSFVGPDGSLIQVYPDQSSPTGYVMKTTDRNGGESFSPGPSPNDPNAQAQWFENSEYGKRLRAAEEAQAAQNAWNRNFQTTGQQNTNAYQMGSLANQRTANTNTAEYQKGLLENAREALVVQKTGQQLQTGYQTLQLGSQLRGPRDLWAYDRTAGAAGSNPLIANAVSTWANMSNNRPTGGGSWNGGNAERMTVGALTSDFGGGGGYTSPVGSIGATDAGGGKQQTLMALDEIARNPQKTSVNWWNTLDPDQQQMALGAFEELGHNPNTVMARYGNSRLRQGIAGSRAA